MKKYFICIAVFYNSSYAMNSNTTISLSPLCCGNFTDATDESASNSLSPKNANSDEEYCQNQVAPEDSTSSDTSSLDMLKIINKLTTMSCDFFLMPSFLMYLFMKNNFIKEATINTNNALIIEKLRSDYCIPISQATQILSNGPFGGKNILLLTDHTLLEKYLETACSADAFYKAYKNDLLCLDEETIQMMLEKGLSTETQIKLFKKAISPHYLKAIIVHALIKYGNARNILEEFFTFNNNDTVNTQELNNITDTPMKTRCRLYRFIEQYNSYIQKQQIKESNEEKANEYQAMILKKNSTTVLHALSLEKNYLYESLEWHDLLYATSDDLIKLIETNILNSHDQQKLLILAIKNKSPISQTLLYYGDTLSLLNYYTTEENKTFSSLVIKKPINTNNNLETSSLNSGIEKSIMNIIMRNFICRYNESITQQRLRNDIQHSLFFLPSSEEFGIIIDKALNQYTIFNEKTLINNFFLKNNEYLMIADIDDIILLLRNDMLNIEVQKKLFVNLNNQEHKNKYLINTLIKEGNTIELLSIFDDIKKIKLKNTSSENNNGSIKAITYEQNKDHTLDIINTIASMHITYLINKYNEWFEKKHQYASIIKTNTITSIIKNHYNQNFFHGLYTYQSTFNPEEFYQTYKNKLLICDPHYLKSFLYYSLNEGIQNKLFAKAYRQNNAPILNTLLKHGATMHILENFLEHQKNNAPLLSPRSKNNIGSLITQRIDQLLTEYDKDLNYEERQTILKATALLKLNHLFKRYNYLVNHEKEITTKSDMIFSLSDKKINKIINNPFNRHYFMDIQNIHPEGIMIKHPNF